ncbi:unnamed protein product [Cuscuta europaea]|uniref:Uncharacterized protein n=1 Tax=Cuscuta europaea TaxID=41803 RepID=A0A9P0YQW7_CUSEU|nr:unnamed protein product [Cuscuta europaea]
MTDSSSASWVSEETSRNEGRDKKYMEGSKRGRPRGSKKGAKAKEIVDLASLLAHCAQAEATGDKKFQQWLTTIRQHSSPYGDATGRVAHCFANALEAALLPPEYPCTQLARKCQLQTT